MLLGLACGVCEHQKAAGPQTSPAAQVEEPPVESTPSSSRPRAAPAEGGSLCAGGFWKEGEEDEARGTSGRGGSCSPKLQ